MNKISSWKSWSLTQVCLVSIPYLLPLPLCIFLNNLQWYLHTRCTPTGITHMISLCNVQVPHFLHRLHINMQAMERDAKREKLTKMKHRR